MISSNTGTSLNSEIEHIRQAIADILTTPIGTRMMRREYGSKVPDLIDQPMNDMLILQLYSAIYTPILRWEDRISIEQITIYDVKKGKLTFDLDATHITTNQKINLNIPLQMGAAS